MKHTFSQPSLLIGKVVVVTALVFLALALQAQNYTLQLLHASDFEGATDATLDAPNFAAVVDALDDTYANTLILSSGDNYIPGPFLFASEDPSMQNPLRAAVGTYFANGNQVRPTIGRADIAILNMIGIEASVFGNHEFDLGTTEVNSMIGVDIRNSGADRRWVGAQFPYLSANLNFASDPALAYLVTADGQEASDFRTPADIAMNNEKKGIARSTVITRNGEKIGIVGATTPRLAQISSPGATQVLDPGAGTDDMVALATIVQPVINDLRAQGINKIIVLAHLQQLALEEQLAPLLSGVDIVVAGGSHTLLADNNDRLRTGDVAQGEYPIVSQNADGEPCLIVNTLSEYKYLGRLVVDFDDQGVIDLSSLDDAVNGAYPTDSLGVEELWAGDYSAAFTPGSKGQNVRDLCNAIRSVIVAKDGNILGKSNVFLEGRRNFVRTEETNFGNLSADANLWQAKQAFPDVAVSIKNGGGIRQAIGQVFAVGSDVELLPPAANPASGKEEGDISQLDLENSLRFNNRLSVLELSAAGLAAVLEHGVRATAPGITPGQFPQVGGVQFSFDPALPAGDRLRSAVITDDLGNTLDTLVKDGEVFGDTGRVIRIVTLNFLAGGGDSYPFPALGKNRVDLDTVLAAIPGQATFTVPGSEQDAFAEYLLTFHPDAASAYDVDDTPVEQDERIQQLDKREDSIFPPNYTLQLLHASDFEGATDATLDAPNFAAVVDALDDTYANTLILSSGDNYIPGPFLFASEDPSMQNPLRAAVGTYFANGNQVRPTIGRADIAILNMIGIEASVFGNHEFDLGTTEVNSMIGVDIRNSGADRRWVGAQFPYLSANLNFASDPALAYLVTADGQEASDFRTPADIAMNNEKKGIARSTVITRNGEKIGIVGATTPRLAQISSPGATQVLDPGAGTDDMVALATIVQPVVDDLRAQGINKIIVLAHLQQLALEEQLAPLLSGVDIVVAGGSHTLLADNNDRLRTGDIAQGEYPIVSQNADGEPCLIVNTLSEYKYLGRLVVDFDDQGVIDLSSLDDAVNGAYPTDSLGVEELWAGDYSAAFTPGSKGQNVRDLCNAIRSVIVAKDGNILGKSNVFLEGRRNFVRTEETNFGNLSADANLWQAKQAFPDVTVSIKNGGGIRQAIGQVFAVGSDVELLPPAANPASGKEEGDISQLDLENSLRFNNRLSVLELSAAGLAAVLEHGVRATAPGITPGQFPQVGGVQFSFDPALPAGDRLRSAVITDDLGNTLDTLVKDGEVFGDTGRVIRIVTLNFLAGGGDSYPFPALGKNRVDLDTVLAAIPGQATFTVPGSEQDAFAEYLLTFHPDAASAYDVDDTPVEQDQRIQQLNRRKEGIFPIGNFGLLTPPDNLRLVTSPLDIVPVTISWEQAENASNYEWVADFPGGNFSAPILISQANDSGRDTTLTQTPSTIDGILAGFGLPAGDSTEIIWTVRAFAFDNRDTLFADDVYTLKLVRDAQIQPFNLLTPTNNSTVPVGGNPNTQIQITWQPTTTAANGPIRYTWQAGFDSLTAIIAPLAAFPADNGGSATTLTFTALALDQILESAGLPVGGSATVTWLVKAEVGQFSRISSQAFGLTLVRTGIIGTYEPGNDVVRLYPNPTSGLITIELTQQPAGDYEIFDTEGRLVQRGRLSGTKENINVQTLQNGVYNLTVKTEGGLFATRFTVQQ